MLETTRHYCYWRNRHYIGTLLYHRIYSYLFLSDLASTVAAIHTPLRTATVDYSPLCQDNCARHFSCGNHHYYSTDPARQETPASAWNIVLLL